MLFRSLPGEIRKRNIRGESKRARESFEANMIGTVQVNGKRLGPAEPRVALHADARRAFQRLDDAEDLRGTEHAIGLLEARREIDDLKFSSRRVKGGFEYICIVDVRLLAAPSLGRADQESSPIACIEERRKQGFGIESRQAAPDNISGAFDQRGKLAVADDADIFEAHEFKIPEMRWNTTTLVIR